LISKNLGICRDAQRRPDTIRKARLPRHRPHNEVRFPFDDGKRPVGQRGEFSDSAELRTLRALLLGTWGPKTVAPCPEPSHAGLKATHRY
jgi:hypothetical protein